jgi:hypothetical protein
VGGREKVIGGSRPCHANVPSLPAAGKESYCNAPLPRFSGRVRPNEEGPLSGCVNPYDDLPQLRDNEQAEKPLRHSKQVGRRICQQRENKPPIGYTALAPQMVVARLTPPSFIVV